MKSTTSWVVPLKGRLMAKEGKTAKSGWSSWVPVSKDGPRRGVVVGTYVEEVKLIAGQQGTAPR